VEVFRQPAERFADQRRREAPSVCMPLLDTDFDHLTGLDGLEHDQRATCQWKKVFEAVALRYQHDDSERNTPEVLLVPQVPIDGHERIEPSGCRTKKFAVLLSGQTCFGRSRAFVSANMVLELARYALVK